MKGPGHEQDITDRISECGFDLELGFLLLMDKAAEAGWTRAEIAIAIASLAENYVLGRAARATQTLLGAAYLGQGLLGCMERQRYR